MKKLSVICLVIVFGLVVTLDAYPEGFNLNYENERESDLSLVTVNSSLFGHYVDISGLLSKGYYLSTRDNLPDQAQSRGKPHVSAGKLFVEILAGMAGNVALGYGVGYIGYQLFKGSGETAGSRYDWFDFDEGYVGAILGYFTGSTFGSALGVYAVGNSRDVRGSFGSAFLGSLLGQGLAIGSSLLVQDETFTVAAFITLPSIFAAILFNRSLRYKSSSGNGTALLNFNKGKFKIGVPYVNVQPLPRFTNDAKRPVRVNVNLLNVAF